MKELFFENGKYHFIHDGVAIENPVMSPDSRFSVNPEFYGFNVWLTGGGNTAHCQEFKFNGKTIIFALTDGDLCHVEEDTKEICAGLFDEDWNDSFDGLIFTRG